MKTTLVKGMAREAVFLTTATYLLECLYTKSYIYAFVGLYCIFATKYSDVRDMSMVQIEKKYQEYSLRMAYKVRSASKKVFHVLLCNQDVWVYTFGKTTVGACILFIILSIL